MIPKLDYYKDKWQLESDHTIKPGLNSMNHALQLLHNPHERLNVVHVAGTNGKGSTIAFLDAISQAHQLKVGRFMSPAILDIHDQLQINGQPIPSEKLDAIFKQFKKVGLSGLLTDFELLTCAAFVYFAHENVDVAIIETGMGGLLDSTNVVTPIVSVITSIALEHTNFLGTTIEEIATHKAGIIKENKPAIIGELAPNAWQVMEQTAKRLNAKLETINCDFFIEQQNDGEVYRNEALKIGPFKRKMFGSHQQNNEALAITAFLHLAKALHMETKEEAICEGIASAQLAGRFEEVLPNVYFDGAHNPHSVAALAATIKEQFPTKRIELLMGMLKDKDVKQVLSILEPLAETIGFLQVPNERALSAEDFYALSHHPAKAIIENPLAKLQEPVAENTIRIVTGSLYLLAHLRAQLLRNK